MKREYSISESAKLLKISRVAVWYAVNQGRLPARKVGHQWIIGADDLENYTPRKYARKI